MSNENLSPEGFYEFDLREGHIRTRDGERVLFFPASIARGLFEAAFSIGDTRTLQLFGAQIGTMIAHVLGDVEAHSPEDVFFSLRQALALFGWGSASLERWGDCAVVRLQGVPVFEGGAEAFGVFLSGLFESLSAVSIQCVPVTGHGHYLIINPDVAPLVRKWVDGGESLSTITSRLSAAEGA